MKTKLLLLILIGWTGILCGQDKVTDDIDVTTVGLGSTPASAPAAKTQKEEITEAVKKILAEKGSTTIGEMKIRERAIVYSNDFAEELKNNTSQNKTKKNVNSKLTKLYLELLYKEKKENKLYSTLEVEVKSSKKKFKEDIVKIDSVKFDVKEGMLEFIKVHLSDGTTYSNRKAPVALLYLDSRGNDRLYDADHTKFVLLKNVVVFDTDRRFGYLPDDGKFSLSNKDAASSKKMLKKDNNLNSIVSFTAYSDLLGLLGDQPNALVNFETKAKFFIHRKNLGNNFAYFLSSIEPYFNYNRLDSKFDSIIVTNNEKVNPIEIFRRHNIAIGGNLSVLRWDWMPSNVGELKFGYMFTSSDLLINGKNTKAINHIKYLDVSLKSMIVDNFGATFNIKYMWQKLNDNENFESIHGKMLPIGGEIFYKSSNKDSGDRVYLRFTNYLILNDRKQDFFQLQVGLTKTLKF